ncbi:MAG: type II toxin-antitoxin system PemK/MazF family toxin [Peptococcales bacterium]|jgi:mRNA interferase MazF
MAYNKYENLLRWSSHKIKLHEKFINNNLTKWKVPRKAIYGCYLGENIGFEKSGLDSRPVLVVSNELVNNGSGNVVVVPLSKNIKWKDNVKNSKLRYYSHYVLYKSKYNKLNEDSAIQCEDIRVISKSRLGNLICFVEDDDMKEINKRIKYTLQV